MISEPNAKAERPGEAGVVLCYQSTKQALRKQVRSSCSLGCGPANSQTNKLLPLNQCLSLFWPIALQIVHPWEALQTSIEAGQNSTAKCLNTAMR